MDPKQLEMIRGWIKLQNIPGMRTCTVEPEKCKACEMASVCTDIAVRSLQDLLAENESLKAEIKHLTPSVAVLFAAVGGKQMTLCEWDPKRNGPSLCHTTLIPVGNGEEYSFMSIGCPNEATVSVGADGQWHLCEACAELPEFKRFRKRTPLRKD